MGVFFKKGRGIMGVFFQKERGIPPHLRHLRHLSVLLPAVFRRQSPFPFNPPQARR